MPRSISPELEKQFAEGLGGSRQLFWMAVGFPFILFFLVEGPWKLFTPQGNEDDSISFGVIATVLAFAILVVLASTGVLPPITFAFVAAYLAITVPIGLWLVRSDERSNTQKLAERRRTYEQGRAVDVTIRIVNEIDIGGVRVYGTLGDREFTIDVPEQLKSRVERGGIIEVLEPPPPASADATIYATALLE